MIGSGSKGNAVLIASRNTLIQIDMGVPLKRVKEGLTLLGKSKEDIKAIFITHEHSDHVGTLNLYHGKIPVFASEGTPLEIDYQIEPYQPIAVGDLNIVPFPVSHDAANPMGYVIEGDGQRLGYVTDTGDLSDDALLLLRDCEFYYFESNHDLKMLRESDRP
ncbi:MAG: MBL fold metallo-hydrolase, partial [Bacilli bacterium]|nr:MBL fold metallo-hydrolase [Bacilli bacterium]